MALLRNQEKLRRSRTVILTALYPCPFNQGRGAFCGLCLTGFNVTALSALPKRAENGSMKSTPKSSILKGVFKTSRSGGLSFPH